MVFYIEDDFKATFEGSAKTAFSKARLDVNSIFQNAGFIPLKLNISRKKTTKFSRISSHFENRKRWCDATKTLKDGDYLFIQYPCLNHSLFLHSCFKKLKKRNVKIVFLLHDLETFRYLKDSRVSLKARIRILYCEKKELLSAYKIIVHNDAMMAKLKEIWPDVGNKCLSLGLFDYLYSDFDKLRFAARKNDRDLPVIIAGNLSSNKAGYVYALPSGCHFNLFGIGYDSCQNSNGDNVNYCGAFDPEELCYHLSGSFGLVWDGPSSHSCSGAFGEYLMINNPHKASMYISAGIPIIIWSKAALGSFVLENNCGICIDSLEDIPNRLSTLSDAEYSKMKENAAKLGVRVREGYFTKRAIGQCIETPNNGR